MALVFRDTFTEASNTTLASHTPDTGTSWTKLLTAGTVAMQVTAATDIAEQDGTGSLSEGVLYTADATYSSADYEVAATIVGTLTSSDDAYVLAARVVDVNNMYAFELHDRDWRIHKRVAGTWTALGAGGTIEISDNVLSSGDRMSFVVVGTTLEARINGLLLESVTDSSLSAAGKAGMGIGAVVTAGNDTTTQAFDNFSVHSIVTGGSSETLRPNAAGDLNQWSHSDGTAGDANNYLSCDESVADDDTTFVETPDATPGALAVDLYNLGATAIGTGTIQKVTVTARIKRGAGWTSLDAAAPAMKIDSTTFYGLEGGLTTSYVDYSLVFYHNPADGTIWTTTDLDALQAGVSYIAENTGSNINSFRATQVFVTVDYTSAATCALTGTVTTAVESDIVTGGKTVILTLTGDTWVTAGATFDGQRQNIINGMDSAQAEAGGWDAKVKGLQGVAGVVRTSATVVTITLDAQAAYAITANETITVTVPSTALTGAAALVASPTFSVTNESSGSLMPMMMLMGVGA
jgi:hypothetical protein